MAALLRRFVPQAKATLLNKKCLLSTSVGGRELQFDQETSNKPRRLKRPELVIFDKDGTLICFDTMAWWIEEFVQRIHNETGVSMDALYQLLHYDKRNGTVSNNSVIARGTNQQVKDLISEYLLDYPKAFDPKQIVDSAFKEIVLETTPQSGVINKPLGDVEGLFNELSNVHNVKLAVCTSDCRLSTIDALKELQILNTVDTIICGDDKNTVPKPDAFNALKICAAFNINPRQTCIIGDTTADVIMGRNAKLGSVLGVLSGVGNHDDLSPYADDILNDIHEINNYFNW